MMHVRQSFSFYGSSVNATGVEKERFNASQVLLRGISLMNALTRFDLLRLDLEADDRSQGHERVCTRGGHGIALRVILDVGIVLHRGPLGWLCIVVPLEDSANDHPFTEPFYRSVRTTTCQVAGRWYRCGVASQVAGGCGLAFSLHCRKVWISVGTDEEATQVVRAWIDAVNAADMESADSLVADTVSITGPRGSTTGREAVSGWVRHTQIRMTVVETRIDGDRVIAEAAATWLVDGSQTGERTLPVTIFMAFRLRDGRIVTIQQLHSLDETVQDQA